jgi:hypothetical protein
MVRERPTTIAETPVNTVTCSSLQRVQEGEKHVVVAVGEPCLTLLQLLLQVPCLPLPQLCRAKPTQVTIEKFQQLQMSGYL